MNLHAKNCSVSVWRRTRKETPQPACDCVDPGPLPQLPADADSDLDFDAVTPPIASAPDPLPCGICGRDRNWHATWCAYYREGER